MELWVFHHLGKGISASSIELLLLKVLPFQFNDISVKENSVCSVYVLDSVGHVCIHGWIVVRRGKGQGEMRDGQDLASLPV